ncbi:MAG: hypothetical protein ACP5H7_02145 [Minisyncoccia bacterium]
MFKNNFDIFNFINFSFSFNFFCFFKKNIKKIKINNVEIIIKISKNKFKKERGF